MQSFVSQDSVRKRKRNCRVVGSDSQRRSSRKLRLLRKTPRICKCKHVYADLERFHPEIIPLYNISHTPLAFFIYFVRHLTVEVSFVKFRGTLSKAKDAHRAKLSTIPQIFHADRSKPFIRFDDASTEEK